MRVIAGEHRGRRLVTPKGERTRPTSDRAREGMFSTLKSLLDLDGARVLDLYAGSGALGLEALSRGAAEVTLVERDQGALVALTKNAALLDRASSVVGEDVEVFLQREPSPYQLVVLDPPYETDVDPVLARLRPWVAEGGVVVVERRTRGPEPQPPEWLEADRSRRYGEATLWYFRAAERGEDNAAAEGA
ncbi:MAG: methyltransferase [Frankiales bacterium]|nr:methyltransferase [Frankiales bacterium]